MDTLQNPSRAFGETDQTFLRVQGLTKSFSGVVALDDVDLSMGAHEAVAVIGPNGAGKSTLLKLIAGVHRPTRGQIMLGTHRLDRLSPHAIANAGVGLAHQVPRPFPSLTVRDNVKVAISGDGPRRAGDSRVSEVLDLAVWRANRARSPVRCASWTSSASRWRGRSPTGRNC